MRGVGLIATTISERVCHVMAQAKLFVHPLKKAKNKIYPSTTGHASPHWVLVIASGSIDKLSAPPGAREGRGYGIMHNLGEVLVILKKTRKVFSGNLRTKTME